MLIVLSGLSLAGTIGPWGYIGIVPIRTAVFRFRPADRMLGRDICSMKR